MKTLIDYYLLKIAQNKNNPKKARAYRTLLNEAIKNKIDYDGNTNTKGI
jgi:hypothetical protein